MVGGSNPRRERARRVSSQQLPSAMLSTAYDVAPVPKGSKYVETHEHNVEFFVLHAGDLVLQLLSLWGIASTGQGCICLNNRVESRYSQGSLLNTMGNTLPPPPPRYLHVIGD